jgi:5-methylcytosine-specific restriction protein A
MADQRSQAAKAWRHLYNTRAWKGIRANQLSAHPLCEWCERRGRITAASICDHAIAHKGDEALFFGGPFLSLCKPCHDGAAQVRDNRGFTGACDASGWPTDPRHPANAAGRGGSKV